MAAIVIVAIAAILVLLSFKVNFSFMQICSFHSNDDTFIKSLSKYIGSCLIAVY